MDKSHIVTIVITAAVTTTITLTITALFAFAKSTATKTITKQNVKKVFSRNNLKLGRNIVGLIIFLCLFEHELFKRTPMTRFDVLNLITYLLLTCICLSAVLWNLSSRKIERELLKEIESRNSQDKIED